MVAPVAAGKRAGLRALLHSMNAEPGHRRPGQRVAAVRRSSSGCTSRAWRCSTMPLQADLRVHGVAPPAPADLPRLHRRLRRPGRRGAGRARAARRARAGARSSRTARASPPAATCWPGCAHDQRRRRRATSTGSAAPCARSARRARCSARWRHACPRQPLAAPGEAETRARASSPASSQDEVGAGRLTLTPPAPTPLGWQLAKLRQPGGRAAGRHRRAAAPDRRCAAVRLPAAHGARSAIPSSARARLAADLETLQELEDHDITNQFTALGAVKPGLFRRWLLTVLLVLTSYACRHDLHPRLSGARADDPLRALGLLRRQAARALRQQLRRQPRELHGRLHQQGRLGPEPRCSATASAGRAPTGWSTAARARAAFKHYQRRHQLPTQVWYKAYPGLDADRPEAQPAHPRRPGAGDDERCAGTRLAEAAMSTTHCRSSSTTSRAWCASATSTTPRRSFLLLRVPDRAAARALARDRADLHRRDGRAAARDRAAGRAHRRRPARARRAPTTIVDALLRRVRRRHGQRRQPRAPPRRRRRQRSEPLALGRRRARAARAAAALRAARQAGGIPERDRGAVRRRLRAHGVPDDHRHGRHRALRLHRRHLAAARRLAAPARGAGRASAATTRT